MEAEVTNQIKEQLAGVLSRNPRSVVIASFTNEGNIEVYPSGTHVDHLVLAQIIQHQALKRLDQMGAPPPARPDFLKSPARRQGV